MDLWFHVLINKFFQQIENNIITVTITINITVKNNIMSIMWVPNLRIKNKQAFINTLQPAIAYLYPLKTSENL